MKEIWRDQEIELWYNVPDTQYPNKTWLLISLYSRTRRGGIGNIKIDLRNSLYEKN
jgi:hypothetical protein